MSVLASALPTDTLLDAKYRIERVLGAGGFGITYQATDVAIGAPVAIKEYFPVALAQRDATQTVRARSEQQRTTFEEMRRAFIREARTLAQFDDPAIVRVLDVFSENDTVYSVMRFEEGGSLKDWLRGLGRAPTQAELDRLLRDLLRALDLVHRKGTLHRDISVDNIHIRPDGSALLLDFGMARQVLTERSNTLSGVVKSGLSPPESYSADARNQGAWTDIYALGATLYQCVAGHLPPDALERMLDDGRAPTASQAQGGYRPAFLEAIDWALAIRPKDRPQSIAEWRAALLGDPAGDATVLPSALEREAPEALRDRAEAGPTPEDHEVAAWQVIKETADPDALRDFLARYPDGALARRAEELLRERREATLRRARDGLRPAPAAGNPARPAEAQAERRGLRGLLGRLFGGRASAASGKRPGEREGGRSDGSGGPPGLVQCSVFAPPAGAPGATVLAQVFLHAPPEAGRVEAIARAFEETAAKRQSATLAAPVKPGQRVDISIVGHGLHVDEPHQAIAWRGASEAANFLLTIPADAGARDFFPVVLVSIDGAPYGRLAFKLTSAPASRRQSAEPVSVGLLGAPYRRAFCSYSSSDAVEVTRAVQVLSLIGYACFHDKSSLAPGERYAEALRGEVERADLFLLFWSHAARRSDWVRQEAEWALAAQRRPDGLPDILPVILEGPPPAPPFEFLSDRHFDDRYQYMIAALRGRPPG